MFSFLWFLEKGKRLCLACPQSTQTSTRGFGGLAGFSFLSSQMCPSGFPKFMAAQSSGPVSSILSSVWDKRSPIHFSLSHSRRLGPCPSLTDPTLRWESSSVSSFLLSGMICLQDKYYEVHWPLLSTLHCCPGFGENELSGES